MKNKYIELGDSTLIELKWKDLILFTIVSSESMDLINEFPNTWIPIPSSRGFYVQGNIFVEGTRKIVSLHRWIMRPPKGLVVDHISRIKLDNRLQNLRNVTIAENNRNRSLDKRSTSGFPNISWDKHNKRWLATITENSTHKFIGRYETIDEAQEEIQFYKEHKFVRKYVSIEL